MVRVLSPTAWGEYSLIFSIMGLIGAFADLRLGRIIIRDLQSAGDRLQETLGSFVTLRLAVGVVGYGAAVTLVWLAGYPTIVVAAMAVAATVLVVAAVGAALFVYFTSQMWMRAAAVAGVLAQASQLMLTAGLALAGFRGLIVFTLPALLFELASLGWQLRTIRGLVRIRLRWDMSRWRPWFREAAVLTIGTALCSVYMWIDTIMLSKITDLPAVGVYAIGSKFATLAGVVPGAISATLIVSMAKSWPGEPSAFVSAFRRAFLLLLVAGTAVALEFSAFSGSAIRVLYGQHYVTGARAAVLLVLAEVLTYFSDLCFVALVAMGRNLPYVVAAGLGVVLNVGVNLILIPRWSYNGAALTTVLTEVLVLVILVRVLWRKGPSGEWLPWLGIAKVAVAGCVMAAAAFSLRGHVPWEMAALTAMAVYLVILHMTRVAGTGGLRALTH